MSSSKPISPAAFYAANVEVHYKELESAIYEKLSAPDGFELVKGNIKISFDVSISKPCAAFFRLHGCHHKEIYGWELTSFEVFKDSDDIMISLLGKPFGDRNCLR